MLNKDAEGVTEHVFVLVHGGKDGGAFVVENGDELPVGIFLDAALEKVGAPFVMHFQHLAEQAVQPLKVGSVCAANGHSGSPYRSINATTGR